MADRWRRSWTFGILPAVVGPATVPAAADTTTTGVASQRGLVSFVILLVLIGGTLLYLRRRFGS